MPRGRDEALVSYVEGTCAGIAVVVWHVGIGATSARLQMARLLAYRRPSLVICAGYAGALQEHLAVANVVFDLRQAVELADLPLPPHALAGQILTVGEVAESPEAKRHLGLNSGAMAVDMETAVLAEACGEVGVLVVALRSISDRVQDALPVPMEHWFDLERQRPAVGALLWHLLTHPGKVMPFVRFVRSLQPARQSLAEALVHLVSVLPKHLPLP